MDKMEVRDQYADGEAARAWARFIGDAGRRTKHYGAFLRRSILQGEEAAAAAAQTLKEKEKKDKKRVLDVACGTGVDSVLLLDTGAFQVTSCDASDQMLKHALRTRWARRREPAFDAWQIEEANWLTLLQDLSYAGIQAQGAYDAVMCLGNSFAHMPATPATLDPQAQQRRALSNFWACVRPGGVLIVDHRNYDHILHSGATPSSCFYYNNSVTDIRTSVVYMDGQPVEVAMDYAVGHSTNNVEVNGKGKGKGKGKDKGKCGSSAGSSSGCSESEEEEEESEEEEEEVKEGAVTRFRLTYYPHRLRNFCRLLQEALGEEQFAAARHAVYADFRSSPLPQSHSPVAADKDGPPPSVYVHVLHKPL